MQVDQIEEVAFLPTEQENIYQQEQENHTKEVLENTNRSSSNICYTVTLVLHSVTTIALLLLCIATLIMWFVFNRSDKDCPYCSKEIIVLLTLGNFGISLLSILFSIIWITLKIYLLVNYKKEFRLFMVIEMILTGLYLISCIIFYVVGYITNFYSLLTIFVLSIFNYNVSVFFVNVILFNFLNIIPIYKYADPR